MAKIYEANPSNSKLYADLLDMESSSYMYIDGVTTVTFFNGPAPLEQFKERLVKVVQASPWLAGRLVKRKGQKVQMEFEENLASESILGLLLHQVDLDISPDMPFDAVIERVKKSNAHVTGGFALLKKGLPFTRATIAKKDEQSWALIFSISHVVADGYTYYKVLGQLSADKEVVAFKPTRHQHFVPKLKEAVGEEMYATVMGDRAALILNYVSNMAFGGKPRVRAFYVDKEKIEAEKQKARTPSGVEFVSTNDVLTAFWGRLTGADLMEMAVNFRGRFPELLEDDAGNYEGCVLFSRADFDDPANIRKALQRKDGKFQSTLEQPLPGFCGLWKCKYRIITNWSSFFSKLAFDGCEQALHLPYLQPGEMPTDICVIFRPTADTYGVYIVTRKLSDATLTGGGECAILGQQICAPAK